MIRLLVILLLINLESLSWCWPGGAPQSACQTLKPKHLFFSPKPLNQSPFRLIQDKANYKPGELVRGMIHH